MYYFDASTIQNLFIGIENNVLWIHRIAYLSVYCSVDWLADTEKRKRKRKKKHTEAADYIALKRIIHVRLGSDLEVRRRGGRRDEAVKNNN